MKETSWLSILIPIGYFVFKILLPIIRGLLVLDEKRHSEEAGYVREGQEMLSEVSPVGKVATDIYHASFPSYSTTKDTIRSVATKSSSSHAHHYPGVGKLLMPTEAKDPSHYYPGVAKLLMPTEAKDPANAYPRLSRLLLSTKKEVMRKDDAAGEHRLDKVLKKYNATQKLIILSTLLGRKY